MRLLCVKLLSAFKNGIVDIFRAILFGKDPDPEKILVFRTGSIGDNICAMPAIVAIRKKFPEAQLHILTNAGASNLVSLQNLLNESYYDKIIDYLGYGKRQLFDIIKKENYDLVIELPQDQATLGSQLRNMIFFRFAGIHSGFGWQVNTIYSFRQAQEKNLKFISERDRLLKIVGGNENVFPLKSSGEDHRIVDKFFETIDPKKFVALVPGAKRPQNRYPIERFEALAAWLIEKNYGVIIVGGPEDLERGAKLSATPGVFDATGKFTPSQSAILLSKCFMTISNDTGPMHLSYASGTPVIGLFSSRDFQEKWFPPKGNIALRNYDVHCSLCFSDSCKNNICMQGIPVDKVKDAFLQIEESLR
jgi:ADP-heptose:LPS heptosyltransferase